MPESQSSTLAYFILLESLLALIWSSTICWVLMGIRLWGLYRPDLASRRTKNRNRMEEDRSTGVTGTEPTS